MKKLMYFTASAVPTEIEAQAIADLRAAAYGVFARNGSDESEMMLGNRREECDFVMGAVPDLYEDKPLFVAPIPGAAQVANGQQITIGASKYTFTVVDGAITAIAVEGV